VTSDCQFDKEDEILEKKQRKGEEQYFRERELVVFIETK